MSVNTGYNGWTNYETWNVALWYGNEQGSQDYWNENAADALRNAHGEADDADGWKDVAVDTLADMMKEDATENTPTSSGFYADLLNAALSEVNWHEIARHYVGEAFDEISKEFTEDEDADE
jgi:hypothetical protein